MCEARGSGIYTQAVDVWAALAIAGFVVVAVIAVRLGRRRRSGQAEVRSAAAEELEAEDLAQLLAAHNARRRARGQAPETANDIERRLEGEWDALAAERARADTRARNE
jgi:flagellar biosynthesis/type III secretory pathway M-ring protein FliF/YscJ